MTTYGVSAYVEDLKAENAELRTKYADAMLTLGLIQQARDLGHVHELLDEFAKAPDFPLSPPGDVSVRSASPGEAGGQS